MAHVLNIVYGSTTINLASGACSLLAYVPRAPTSLEDDATVTEPCKIEISGASVAAVQTALQGIELAFRQAERYQDRLLGDRVYIEFTPDGYSDTYRSELLTGKPDFDSNTLDDRWVEKKIDVTLNWTRRNHWDGPETQIPLDNLHHAARVFSAEISDPSNALSGYANITGVTDAFTNDGRLYFNVYQGLFPTDAELSIFSDEALTNLVGHIATGGVGPNAIIADGGSGLGGTITIDTLPTSAFAVAFWDIDLTLALTVYNHSDTAHANYVEIAAADVVGDLPAAVRLEITNSYNSSNRLSNVYMAHNVLSDPANLDHILEAEDGTGGTTTADATCSNGSRKDLSWTDTAEAELLNWTLSTALLNACRGNFFRLLARFSTAPSYTNAWAWWRIKFALTTIWEGQPLLLSSGYEMQDIGLVQLPPYLVGAGDLYPLNLVLCVRRAQSGTHTLNLDYVQLSPLDGWRKLSPRGYGAAYTVRLVDDGIEGYVYTDGWATAGKTGHYAASGRPIEVWPGAAQRLYVSHDAMSGSAGIDRTLAVKAFYRPRRLTL